MLLFVLCAPDGAKTVVLSVLVSLWISVSFAVIILDQLRNESQKCEIEKKQKSSSRWWFTTT